MPVAVKIVSEKRANVNKRSLNQFEQVTINNVDTQRENGILKEKRKEDKDERWLGQKFS